MSPLRRRYNQQKPQLKPVRLRRVADNGVDKEDLSAVVAALRAKGVEKVMITLGSNGSVVCSAEGICSTACVRMPEVYVFK